MNARDTLPTTRARGMRSIYPDFVGVVFQACYVPPVEHLRICAHLHIDTAHTRICATIDFIHKWERIPTDTAHTRICVIILHTRRGVRYMRFYVEITYKSPKGIEYTDIFYKGYTNVESFGEIPQHIELFDYYNNPVALNPKNFDKCLTEIVRDIVETEKGDTNPIHIRIIRR